MFKKYRFEWEGKGGKKFSVDFYVHSKGTRSGFMHRACVIGPLPRLDDMGTNWSEYKENEDKLLSKRVAKITYCNRTWEYYPGQETLSKLWEQLNKFKFVDMSQISKENPFCGQNEPKNEELPEPESLFDGLSRR